MKTVDTCETQRYSPLIVALKAFYEASCGESLAIVMDNASAFSDLKEFLAEQHVGFREVYDGDRMILQFTK